MIDVKPRQTIRLGRPLQFQNEGEDWQEQLTLNDENDSSRIDCSVLRFKSAVLEIDRESLS